MANKTFEDLAKELGYISFADMKRTIGRGKSLAESIFSKKRKSSTSPTKVGNPSEGSISEDIIPFLNIIAKNSLALPGMARDMNVLRQNIVKLVKLKNAEALTKADKFFKSEDQREAELEAARKQETAPIQEREGKAKKERMEKGGEEEGILSFLWDLIKSILGGLFIGLGMAFLKVFDLGKLMSDIADKLNPLPLIEGLFETIKEGWQKITETDIVKETLIKGVGKFLDFITAGLFGEKELRKSLDSLSEYLAPMIDVMGETFNKIVSWLKDNVGWDPFTIPLSKINDIPGVGDLLKKIGLGFSDIQVPGFRPFDKKKESVTVQPTGATAPVPPPKEDLGKGKTALGETTYDAAGNVVSSDASAGKPTKEKGKTGTASKESLATKAETNKEAAIEFLRKKAFVQIDPNSKTGFSRVGTNFEISEQAVRQAIADEGGNPDKILKVIRSKETSPEQVKAATSTGAVGTTTDAGSTEAKSASGATGMSGAPSTASSVTPSESSPSPAASSPTTSGAALSSTSSEVAEGQRMDSAADAGVYVDAGTVNNSSTSTGKKPKETAGAYNSEFINSYYAVP
jgi:hypothetical protein